MDKNELIKQIMATYHVTNPHEAEDWYAERLWDLVDLPVDVLKMLFKLRLHKVKNGKNALPQIHNL